MSRLGLNKSLVYHGDTLLGELDTVPVNDTSFRFPNNEIRIQRILPNSERCPPLSVLQAISSASVRCKLESSSPIEQADLINLHASCFYGKKTAVLTIGEEEIHLVAMPSKLKKFPCFWCYSVPPGLYTSCLGMLNMRCLSIVFDLDETLIVANTMKSFEDRMEALRCWIAREADPIRSSGMSAEHKRCADDRLLLKQYMESDYVMDNGKVLKAQLEEASLDNPERVRRPVIRLPERNVVLTRINPEIRDTSILVRLRPAWEDLRSYLIAKGRKRFEVYVCTMAERDYALEMWRLLDPEGHLIGQKQLLGRIVCVKSGFKKSLLNVFQNGICHPKMAMVIDDRAKVWEDIDQPRVHVVPPFTPYFAPQAETANAVPVLCVARNVACNVRGGFFKEFDENFFRRISELFYEDEVVNLPSAPDVSNYLMSEIYEEGGFLQNGNTNAPIAEGMSGAEVEQRLNQSGERNVLSSAANSMDSISDSRTEPTVPSISGSSSFRSLMPSQKPSLLGAPVRRDSMKQGDPPILSRVPAHASLPFIQPQGGWLVDEEFGRGNLNIRNPGFAQETDAVKIDKRRANHNPFYQNSSTSAHLGLLSHPSQVKGDEAFVGHEWTRQLSAPTHSSEGAVPHNQVYSSGNLMAASLSIGVLHEIGRKCSSKVEFRSVISTSKDLQFSVEVLFTGEKIGFGMGKTRKDAQQQAAENALHSLADKYVAFAAPSSGAVDNDFDKLSLGKENGFLWETSDPETNTHSSEDVLPNESSTEGSEAAQMDTSSYAINQVVQKRASSPRLPQSVPNKRSKEEPFHDSQNHSSSRFQ